KPLPESIDADVLLMLNMLLSRQDLLADYMKSAAPDSLKRIIALAGNEHPQGQESKITNYKIEYKNRIVLERLYEGLIMPCALRDAGNTISTSKLDLPKALRQGLDNFPDIGITFKLGPVSVNPVKFTQSSLKIYDGFKNLTDYGDPSSNIKLDLQNEQRMKNANPAKFAEFARNQAANPGGAIAEVRKKYVDDISKPYFLVLNYGLGYDYFQ
ncbi:MAG: hypothetical protein HUU01_12265, partial [Saprospiraceae bacterium]|nr:hypothetical protein [Saprospiraceae bacterium]